MFSFHLDEKFCSLLVDTCKPKFSSVSARKQAQTFDNVPLRLALVRSGMTVSELAEKVKRPRPTVSAALNRGKFPRVLALIKEALDVA